VTLLSHPALGRYQIEEEIGRGAMGTVYRAFDPKINRVVALKTISVPEKEPEAQQKYRDRLVEEARAAGRLSHPGIVTVYDAAEDAATHEPYIVMEYIAGDSLAKTLSASGRLPLSDALQIAEEIAEALDYAHSQGVIHRDIKPANIIVTPEGHARLTDFGVARLNQELMTPPGQVVGSPAYMSPEQMSGGIADARSDLFSLGIVLYSMITGFRPFQGNSAQTVCHKVINVDPVPVTSFQADLPPKLDELVSRAIAKDPKDRFQSGAEMSRAIQAFRQAEPSTTDTTLLPRVIEKGLGNVRPLVPDRRLSRMWHFSIAISAVAMLVVAAIFLAPPYALKRRTGAPSLMQQSSLPPTARQQQPVVETRATIAKRKAVRKSKASAVALAPATVQVEIQHHFAGAAASVWLDDRLVFHQTLQGGDHHHALFRTVVMNQVSSFQLDSGRHLLAVRVVSPTNTYDQTEMLDAELAPGSQHILMVNCDRRKLQISLQ